MKHGMVGVAESTRLTYIKVSGAVAPWGRRRGGGNGMIPDAIALGVGTRLAGSTLTSILALGLTSAASGTCNLRAHASFCGGFSGSGAGIKGAWSLLGRGLDGGRR